MKVTELMIGDWVCLERDTEYNSPLRVESLTIANNMVNTSDEEWWYGEYIIPIPITEEMIRLNKKGRGIIDQHGKVIYILSEDCNAEIRYSTMNGYELHISSKDYDIKLRVNYIHEVQHAFRLVGLNNLADNWKVKYED